jgi:hypothetical protein
MKQMKQAPDIGKEPYIVQRLLGDALPPLPMMANTNQRINTIASEYVPIQKKTPTHMHTLS